ncbi:MAG: hypothetical protein QM817_38800 [Archangium sp.]
MPSAKRAAERSAALKDFLAKLRADELLGAKQDLAALPEMASVEARFDLLTELATEVGGVEFEWVVMWLVEQLARARLDGVSAVLAKMARQHAQRDRGPAAVEALTLRNDAVAHEALQQVLAASVARKKPTENDERAAFLAASALVKRGELDELVSLLTPESVSSRVGRVAAHGALKAAAKLPVKQLDAWAKVCVRLLNGPVDLQARELLNRLPEKELRALLPVPAKRGEEPERARASVERTMLGVKRELERVIAALRELEYPFAFAPIEPAGKSMAKDLAAMEKILGAPLPLSYRLFHELIGGVDLCRDHTLGVISRLGDLQWSDPLQVAPLDVARDFLVSADKASKRKWVEALRVAPRLMLGMSPDRKGHPDQEDDGGYELEVVGHPIDGVVYLQGRPVGSFVEYLRSTLKSGGFAALSKRPKNSAQLRKKLTAGWRAF